MRVLELCCGLGGWSKPFAELGHDCTGVDIQDFAKDYPGKFIQADLFDWEPTEDYDVVLCSPLCSEFSIAKKWGQGTQNESKGLNLVWRCFYLVDKIKPKYWALENVKGLAEFLPPPRQIIKYGSRHKQGKAAYLWGNFPLIGFLDGHFKWDYRKGDNCKKIRGLIPYPIAKAMCKVTDSRKCN